MAGSRDRTRVASSDWWASRKVVSVSAPALLVHPLRKALGAQLVSFCFVPAGGVWRLTRGSRASAIRDGRTAGNPGLPLTITSPIKRNARRAVALARNLEQLRRLVDKPGRVRGRLEPRMHDQLIEETQVRTTPRIRIPRARGACAQSSLRRRRGAVTFTSSESYERVMNAPV